MGQVNSALHPSGVAKSSTSFGWDKGGKVTSAGWQVTLCDLIWHVISRSGVVISITNCYIRFTLPLLYLHDVIARNICTWFYVVAQMMQRVNDFIVTFLGDVSDGEFSPAWIPRCLRKYIIERTTLAFYISVASIPRTAMKYYNTGIQCISVKRSLGDSVDVRPVKRQRSFCYVTRSCAFFEQSSLWRKDLD